MIRTDFLNKEKLAYSFTHKSKEEADEWVETFKKSELWEEGLTHTQTDLSSEILEIKSNQENIKKTKEEVKKADIDKMDLVSLREVVKKIISIMD